MSDEIQEELEKIYKFPIEVKFTKMGYDIFCKLEKDKFILPIIYNRNETLESNIHNIEMKIDKELLFLYKK